MAAHIIRWANQTEIKTVDWLWKPFIPYGKVTFVEGDDGEGKTTMILAFFASGFHKKVYPRIGLRMGRGMGMPICKYLLPICVGAGKVGNIHFFRSSPERLRVAGSHLDRGRWFMLGNTEDGLLRSWEELPV